MNTAAEDAAWALKDFGLDDIEVEDLQVHVRQAIENWWANRND